ncbi:hypothetical protein KRP22_000440 [Phytophthora ramorum]|nr:E3 ubiquitin-protein ligase RING1-like [Phytophthora ramorum]
MEVTVRVEVHYCTPPDTVLGDLLHLLRSRTWAAFMVAHVTPRLEKVSPVDNSVLARLDRQWQAAGRYEACATPVGCVVCMDADDGVAIQDSVAARRRPNNSGVQLPCGHVFHRRCIHSWLELQSTCPVCRFQFPKEFAGRLVVRRLRSMAVLPHHVSAWSRANISRAPVGGHSVRVVVNLTLEKELATMSCRVHCPCELTALLLDETNGDMFSELDTRSSALSWQVEAPPPRHRIAATRFATVEEAKISDGVSSSVAPRETGRKRRCCRLQAGTNKRQRVSSE